jgi:hypothetical protein
MKDLRLVEVNTTAYEEENFLLITDLTDEQIKTIVTPIVMAERNETSEYDNDTLCELLRESYPSNVVIDYATDTFDKIKI